MIVSSVLLASTAALLLGGGVGHAPVTAQNLVLRMTGDLPALCGTSRSDPGATAVIHF
jgi:hypothetical protein